VPGNPARLIATPKQDKRLPAVLTVDDALRLMNAPAGNAVDDLRDRAVLETLYSTGIRASELVGSISKISTGMTISSASGAKDGRSASCRLVARPRSHRCLLGPEERQGQRCVRYSPALQENAWTARTVQRILGNYRKKARSFAEGQPPHAPPQLCDAPAGIGR